MSDERGFLEKFSHVWGIGTPETPPPALFTGAQLADITKILERINQEHKGFGEITFRLHKGKVVAIISKTEWRYE